MVREALEKEGWTITNDPYLIRRLNRKPFEVDLGAEKFIAAERGSDLIAVEIKSFLGSSMTYDFHAAFGQYGVYRFFRACLGFCFELQMAKIHPNFVAKMLM